MTVGFLLMNYENKAIEKAAQAKNRISLQPLYGDRIGIWNDGEWYRQGLLDLWPTDFKSPKDALPTLQWLRWRYVHKFVSRMKLKKELKKY